MIIESLRLKLWNFDFDLKFSQSGNLLISRNGGGKTTVLNVLAALTGNDAATYLVEDMEFDHVDIQVMTETGAQRFKGKGRLDFTELVAFKARLPERTSFAVTENYYDTRFQTTTLPPSLIARNLNSLGGSSAALLSREDDTFRVNAGGDGFMQKIRIVSRMTPRGVPILIESPENHIDYASRYGAARYIRMGGQYFVTTHCPSILTAFQNHAALIDL